MGRPPRQTQQHTVTSGCLDDLVDMSWVDRRVHIMLDVMVDASTQQLETLIQKVHVESIDR